MPEGLLLGALPSEWRQQEWARQALRLRCQFGLLPVLSIQRLRGLEAAEVMPYDILKEP
jgi:hypothetical protein